VLLKLSIYGYLNRVQSSRRLEREACRSVEVMWPAGRLVPEHKTIADFRKDNGPAIRHRDGPCTCSPKSHAGHQHPRREAPHRGDPDVGVRIVRFGATRSLTADRASHVDSSSQL
jgi:hypothetical protein